MTSVYNTIAVMLVASSGTPGSVSTLRQLGPALTSCFHAPEHSAGSEMTVRFSLTRQGTVLGTPRITFSKLVGTPIDQKSFVAAALGALASCTPVAVTPELGGAIAGRPLSVHFIGGPPAKPI